MKIDTVIFDLGNVLVRWSPTILYDKIFSDKKERDHFLNNVATMDWHSEQDAGRSPQEATEQLVKEHPDWAHPIRAFYARWKEMFAGPIEGSVDILKELKEKGYKVYALSNWNAELFNDTLDDFPFLQWFDDKVISGEVKLKKPTLPFLNWPLNASTFSHSKRFLLTIRKQTLKRQRALACTASCLKVPKRCAKNYKL
jgi:2-haloacid dehalogenase